MGNPDKIVAVGLGEVLYDHDVVTDEYTFGGAPANFADHFLKCSRLISGPDAAEVHVVSAVGDDERGRAVSAELEARGLCDGLCRVGELPTGVVDKRRDAAGVNAYEILPGAWDAMTWSDALARLAARTDVVCFGSLGAADAARVRRQPAAGFLLAGGAGGVDGSLQYFEDQRRGGSARGRMPDRMSRRRSGRAVPGVARPPGEPRNGHPHRGRRGQPRVHPEPDFGLCDSPRGTCPPCRHGRCGRFVHGGVLRDAGRRVRHLAGPGVRVEGRGFRLFVRGRHARSTRPRRKRNFQGICNVLSDKDRDMETYRYNTLRFFRVQFGLPARMPLEWCVVRETSRAGSELRLGVALKGTGLYIDVAMRRFFSQIDIPLIERRCYPAERISRGNDYEYRSAEGWSFTCPKHYICDIYYPARFSRELLAHSVL